MAKYRLIEDFKVQYNPAIRGLDKIASDVEPLVLQKGDIIEGLDVDGKGKFISTTFGKTMPDTNVFGQQWIAIPIEKLKEIKQISKPAITTLRIFGALVIVAAIYGTLKFTKIIK